MNQLYTSRSAADQYQRCPRSRWYQYLYPDENGVHKGLVGKQSSIPLTTGLCVHKGVEFLLKRHKNYNADIINDPSEVDIAVQVAQKEYHNLISELGFTGQGMNTPQKQAWTYREQLALTEALVRVWCMVEAPQLLAEYKIVGTEQELEPIEIAPNVFLQSRADALLKNKEDGGIYVYSLKTIKSWDIRSEKSYANDLQGITEIYCLENQPKLKGKLRCMGVRFCHLVKGKRESLDRNDPTSNYYNDSPLVRGWKYVGQDSVQFAHSFWFSNPNNASGKGRLGNGYEKFHVWEDEKIGVKKWVRTLAANRIQPEEGDVIRKQVITPAPVFRDKSDIESRIRQIAYQEDKVLSGVKNFNFVNSAQKEDMIDESFPQYSHGCFYPGDCEYVPMCYDGAIRSNPLELYQIRTSHHEAEREYLGA